MGSEKSFAGIAFAPGEADRRVAGVAAAARVLRRLAEDGAEHAVLAVPGGALRGATLTDIARLAPGMALEVTSSNPGGWPSAPRLRSADILRATGKAGDGLVSRWLNRPVSRAISAFLLHIPGIRPIHATIGTALIALVMFAALIAGGVAGLVAGGLLYHAASVFDGVDGEIARATFRTSRSGALLDSLIDMATNFLFGVGLTLNLAAREPLALTVGAWGIGLFILGMAAISFGAAGDRRPFSMNGVKERLRAGGNHPFLAGAVELLIAISSRDFCALLAALMVLAGWPMALLLLYAAGASVWILFVLGALLVPRSAGRVERSA